MAFVIEPVSPCHIFVTLLAAVTVILLLVRGTVDRWRVFGRTRKTRLAVLVLSLVAVVLFAIAALNPRWVRGSDPGSLHLVVAVDVSDSVLRADGGWQQIRTQAHELISSSSNAVPEQIRNHSTASILTFGKGVVVAVHDVQFADLPDAFSRLNDRDFAPGEESDVGAGLVRAGELIERTGGRGAILLISDGNQTIGDASAEAERLAKKGIAIHVHPIEGGRPELAIVAADLPRQVNAGAETLVRGVLWNGSSNDAEAILTLSRNPGIEDGKQFGPTMVSETGVSVPAGRWARFRQPATFQSIGLQYVELTLMHNDGREQQRRRFFAYVNQPPKILAIGGDNAWVAALAPVAAVTQIRPEEFFDAIDPGDYDAIVISSVPAPQFPDGALDVISDTVRQDGVGLMFVNGDHRGMSDEMETILTSYADTPLDSLLPVIGNPVQETPARQVVVMIDASGSMSGRPTEKAKQIARHIVQDLLHERDRLDLITFTVGAHHLVADQLMDEKGMQDAVRQIDSIAGSGGTNPSQALALIAEREMINCNLILISDGFFHHVDERPDCQATVFAIGHASVPANSPLWDFANPIPVPESFDPSDIKISSLDPLKRFFVPGSFVPRAVSTPIRPSDLSVPELPLDGTAMTFIKEGADLVVVRPKLANPVLAYGESGTGYVGVLTTAIPPVWVESEEGRRAIEAWITHVMPYSARDRYDFWLTDRADRLTVRISLIAQDGRVPEVDRLDAVVEIQGEAASSVQLNADPDAAATFSGWIQAPRNTRARDATLTLVESGPDALSRVQRVPILIPPRAVVDTQLHQEAYCYGMNEPLLREIAESGGGVFDLPNGTPFFRGRIMGNHDRPLWPVLIIAATICYLAAIALRRLDL